MDLIERLRPKWRHPDAQVRRGAIQKLDDVATLEQLASADPEPPLRELAAERLREVLVAVASGDEHPVPDCQAALGRIADEPTLVAVATHARHEAVRRDALARVSAERLLRDVVRSAADPAIRRAALDRITDPTLLRGIAVGDGPGDLALAAVERITEPRTLQAIAEHPHASKHVRQRARALLPAEAAEPHALGAKEARARQLELSVLVQALRAEPDVGKAAERVHAAQREWRVLVQTVTPHAEVAEHFTQATNAILADAAVLVRRLAEADHAEQALAEGLAAREALCVRVEALDGSTPVQELAEARAAWQRLAPLPAEHGAALAQRFAAAAQTAEARHAQWRARDTALGERAALVREAEALAGTSPPPKAKAWHALERRWQATPPGDTSEEQDLARRFAEAGERLARRRQESQQEEGETQQEHLRRLQALLSRLGELAVSETFKLATARRALEAADAALEGLPPLPPGERRAEWTERLTEAHQALLRRVRHEEETEEWRRWANASAQEEIIARIEALLEANDVTEGTKLLGHLPEQWEAVATATPEKAQALWERFRTVRNELRRRCDAFLQENLDRKRALVAAAAALGDSTAWNETAEALKRIQAEWKAIGPVPIKIGHALWQEFRAPADRFFSRRKEHFAKVDAERGEHAKAKVALCEQAEALADSTDWDATAAAIKQLQAEWKRGGAPPRAQAEQLWQRFRAACDRFFDRHRRRGELARDAEVEKAEAICNGLEAVAAALGAADPPASDEVGRQLDAAWGDWIRLDTALLRDTKALDERLRTTCERIAELRPDSLQGTRLDPATTRDRREKLCARLEALSPSPDQPKLSLQEMALALRERLATNTMSGGKGTQGPKRDTAQELERITASWSRLGPPIGDEARAQAERFEQARARLSKRQ